MKKIVMTFAVLLIAVLVFAQNGAPPAGTTPVQQSIQHADAANFGYSSATSSATITIPAPGGQSANVYITEVDITNCAGASAVTAAAVTTVTTTNLTGAGTGSGPIWTLGSGTTAGACQPTITAIYPTGLRSTVPNTAVTFILPAFATNQTVRVNVVGYVGP